VIFSHVFDQNYIFGKFLSETCKLSQIHLSVTGQVHGKQAEWEKVKCQMSSFKHSVSNTVLTQFMNVFAMNNGVILYGSREVCISVLSVY
jgi:hypothetical protein